MAALLLYLEEIPVYSPSGPALGSICNNIKCICLVLYVNLQRLIAGSLEGQETIHIFRLTQKNQLECQFFKTLPWPLCNMCWIFHEYNIKIIHHCLKKKKNQSHCNRAKYSSNKYKNVHLRAKLQEPYTQPCFSFVKA